MSEAISISQFSRFCNIGTDAKIGIPATLARYLYEPKADNMMPGQSTNWDEKTYLEKAEGNRKTETSCMYSKDIADMGITRYFCVRDLVKSGGCVSFQNGQNVYDALRSAISHGNEVCLSFESIKSLSTAFLRSAIGQLYNGDIKGNIDERISYSNLSPERRLIVNEVIRSAKGYYSDPEAYVAKVKELFADD